MSDNTTSDNGEPGLLERLGESLGFDIDRIRSELDSHQHETGPYDAEKGPLLHPTDEAIVEQAISALIDHKQRDKARDMPRVEDHRNVQVEIEIEDPHIVVHQFAQALYEESEALVAYLHENSLFEVGGPSLEADDEELITYIIEERDEPEEKRPAALIGGATPLRINLADREGFTEDEARLIKLANTIAVRKNGYDRHLLLDEVLIVPLYEPSDNPYQQ
jgi:hypothetical protein